MKKNNKKFLIIGLLAVGLIGWRIWYVKNSPPGKYDGFATCLKEKGAVFYGAFWCPHCQSQKKLFGRSEKLLPYVECSTSNGQTQTQECTEKGIDSYPTWIFATGEKLTGELSLSTLAEKTGCVLP